MKHVLKLAMIMAVLALPGLALATHWDGSTFNADCDSWCIEAGVIWGTATYAADVDFAVVLTDDMGMEIARVEDAFVMTRTDGLTETVTYCGDWGGVEICGDVTASFVMNLEVVYDSGYVARDQVTGSEMFNCPCDETEGCFRTPGYWKNHPDDPAWPVDGFSIGGVPYSNAELIAIMKTSVKGGDATVILAHHLIAAKLNVLAGENVDELNDAIAHGDDLLMMYPLGSDPEDKDEILMVKDILEGYNELGCDDEDDDYDDMDSDKSLPIEESSTWGNLKADFR